MNTHIEENYLKAIYRLSMENQGPVSTSALAAGLGVQAASVTDMLKKLAARKLIKYRKYHGVEMTPQGSAFAVAIVRKHRLWEVFLVQKLGFNWGAVHDIAEQLEHVHSEELTDRLDAFLGYPDTDPHGDPIPDKNGLMRHKTTVALHTLKPGERGTIAAVKHDGRDLLDYLERHHLVLHSLVRVVEVLPFDGSMQVAVAGGIQYISGKIAESILVVRG
jgi:DtxR family Mn-dependent transcriptional regulator